MPLYGFIHSGAEGKPQVPWDSDKREDVTYVTLVPFW